MPEKPDMGRVQPSAVWADMMFVVALLLPSMMSISPMGPYIQKAGQTPQAELGMWAKSAMTRPWFHDIWLWMRVLPRPASVL